MNFSPTELYIFCLCAVVFTLLTVLLTALIVTLLRYYLRLVRLGSEDERIRKEYDNRHCQSKLLNALGFIINFTICIVLVAAFAFSLSVRICEKENCTAAKTGIIRVVRSNSMAKAYEKNEYLFENNLDGKENNFNTFDIIYTDALPAEEDLKLYDVVVYDLDGYLIIHRIIKIEEPNEEHPDERYYYLRGDNNIFADSKPVTYDQMRGIWNGQKVENVGSFILFMQSPAGYLCILLMLFVVIALPIVTKIVENERSERYQTLTGVDVKNERKYRREERVNIRMDTYYNRPDSPYSGSKVSINRSGNPYDSTRFYQ